MQETAQLYDIFQWPILSRSSLKAFLNQEGAGVVLGGAKITVTSAFYFIQLLSDSSPLVPMQWVMPSWNLHWAYSVMIVLNRTKITGLTGGGFLGGWGHETSVQ